MTATISEFRQFLLINKNDLDGELEHQAEQFFRVAEESAMAISRRDEAKERRDQIQGRVYEELASRGEKISDAKLKMLVQQDERYIQANREYASTAEESMLWTSLVGAMEQRGSAIRKLADLYVAGYFAAPAAIHGGSIDLDARKGRESMAQSRQARRTLERG